MYKINCENIGDVKKYLWHYRRGNSEYGPFTYEDIIEKVKNGDIGSEDYVLKFGNKKFVKANEIQGLFDAIPQPEKKQEDQEEQLIQIETPEKEAILSSDKAKEELHAAFDNKSTFIHGQHKKEDSNQKVAMVIAGVLGLSLAVWLLLRFF